MHGYNHTSIQYQDAAKWSEKRWNFVRLSDGSVGFWKKKQTSSSSCQRLKGPSRLLSVTGAKGSAVMIRRTSAPTAWVTCLSVKVPLRVRHILGLYKDRLLSNWHLFPRSPWLLDRDNATSHSACAATAWIHRHRVDVLAAIKIHFIFQLQLRSVKTGILWFYIFRLFTNFFVNIFSSWMFSDSVYKLRVSFLLWYYIPNQRTKFKNDKTLNKMLNVLCVFLSIPICHVCLVTLSLTSTEANPTSAVSVHFLFTALKKQCIV